MKSVCVITGGGSGMGLATARLLASDYQVVISGRTREKLERAANELRSEGFQVQAIPCDVADNIAVEQLAERAGQLGPIEVVINAAGIAPQLNAPEDILRTNALGTVHIHNAFFHRMVAGGCLIDVGSTGGYMVNSFLLPTRAYKLSNVAPGLFIKKLINRANWFPKSVRSGFAYCISKNFVMWYAATEAKRFATRNLRVLSVSPGSFDTDMGRQAKAGADKLIEFCAIRRYGRVEEIAQLLAFCADKRLGYLTGVDVLCDGGCLAGCRSDPMGFLRLNLEFARGEG